MHTQTAEETTAFTENNDKMLRNYRTLLEKDLQSATLRYKDKLGLEILKKRDGVSVVWS